MKKENRVSNQKFKRIDRHLGGSRELGAPIERHTYAALIDTPWEGAKIEYLCRAVSLLAQRLPAEQQKGFLEELTGGVFDEVK